MTPVVEIQDLSVVFSHARKQIRALDGLNLSVGAGEIFGFLGPNGAGKTTAMHVLLGFIAPTSGTARILGTDVRQSVARRRIGYLPEQPDTYPFLSGRELLHWTGGLFGMPRSDCRRRADELLAAVGLTEAADRRIAQYSRGMLQRVCLAQALVNDPELVILDEPTGGLDPLGRMLVRRIIESLRERGKTVFFSSHELSEVELVCDHLAVIAGGRILAEGATETLVPADQSLERFFLGLVGGSATAAPRADGDRKGACGHA